MAKEMTLAEIRQAKQLLEHELRSTMAMLFADFREKTGLGAEGVDVRFEAVSRVGTKGYTYTLSEVKVDVGSI